MASAHRSHQRIAKTIWLTRPDLRAIFADEHDTFQVWLHLHGNAEYRALEEHPYPLPLALIQTAAPDALPDVQPRMTRLMRALWRINPDLQKQFDISTSAGQQAFTWYAVTRLLPELRLIGFLSKEQRAALNALVPTEGNTNDPQITCLMLAMWQQRADLQASFDIATSAGRRGLIIWMIEHGFDHLGIANAGLGFPAEWAHSASPRARPEVEPQLTQIMELIWSHRSDLQQAYDLDTQEGQQGFVWWCFLQGITEMRLGRLITNAQRQILAQPADSLPQDTFLPITRHMVQVHRLRTDVAEIHDLSRPEGRAGFVNWYFTRGLVELQLDHLLTEAQIQVLAAPSEQHPDHPRILTLIWHAEPALHAEFPEAGHPAFRGWAATAGADAYPILKRCPALRPTSVRATHKATLTKDRIVLPFGVNLIGYARGQLGIGEDVRMAALALQAANIPFSIYNVEPGEDVCQGDTSADAHLADTLPYAVNLICMTGIETARLAAVAGSNLFRGRYNIGYWPWELPAWPTVWRHAYDLVDELWASSRYTFGAYADSCPKPIRHMPMAVTVEPTGGLTRKDFGLAVEPFLFVFAFDSLSSLARKNPVACVQAFRAAFPRGDEPAGLILKAMRADPMDPHWQALVNAAKADPRIRLVDGTLSRGDLHDFYRACDCYISLHRSEGFGRGMAECMLLGKPVIATGFSGNLDFTVPGSAALVDYRLRPLSDDEYPHGAGQVWAEPDIAHAAWWMRRIATQPELAQRLANSARLLTTAAYAPEAVGAHYAAVLREQILASRSIQS